MEGEFVLDIKVKTGPVETKENKKKRKKKQKVCVTERRRIVKTMKVIRRVTLRISREESRNYLISIQN